MFELKKLLIEKSDVSAPFIVDQTKNIGKTYILYPIYYIKRDNLNQYEKLGVGNQNYVYDLYNNKCILYTKN